VVGGVGAANDVTQGQKRGWISLEKSAAHICDGSASFAQQMRAIIAHIVT
jgi:hypothetical protein